MNRDETRKLLAEIRALYPAFCRGRGDRELSRIIDAWARVLAPLCANDAREGFYRYARENRYAPAAAEVVAEARRWRSDQADPLQQCGYRPMRQHSFRNNK